MDVKPSTLILLAVLMFLSISKSGLDEYKRAKLKSLYGDDYYRYVYFVDESRYKGINLDL